MKNALLIRAVGNTLVPPHLHHLTPIAKAFSFSECIKIGLNNARLG